MSTEFSPGGSARNAPHAAPSGHSNSDFFAWVRGLGIVRGSDRWAGGVASGLAHRWRIDPILVRGLFIVVGLFPGIGVLAYGILWMILPEPDGRIHLQDAVHGRWTSGMTGALVTIIVGLGGAPIVWFGDARWTAPIWILLWVGVAFLVVYGITSSRRVHRAGPASFAGAPPDAQSPLGAPYLYEQSAPPSDQSAPEQPAFPPAEPSSGPRASYGYTPPQVPPRVQPPQPVRQHRQSVTGSYVAVVMGLAVFIPGVLLGLQISGFAVIDPSTGVLWALAAGIIALGIIVAGINGRTSGVLSLFAVLALAGGIITQPAYDISRTPRSVTSSPSTVQEATQGYTITAASGLLDLRALDNAGPLSSDSVVPVDATMSQVRIEIPKGVPVRVQADVTMGNVQFGNRTSAGLTTSDSQTYNQGSSGATLVVAVHATMSNVEIDQEQ
ncbi:PspC domain-containing protein [Sinomonas sp.]|uniref:PspC domain-containing protein n=1 Tax=Sinomonas sp. TaxID=1914986 RepID=UPI003F809F87